MKSIVIQILLFLTVLLSAPASFIYSQQPAPSIKKSELTEMFEGKKYHVHIVEKGQTLYSIAKTYGSTVDIVLANNPDAKEGLKVGSRLRIPFLGDLKKAPEPVTIKEVKKEKPVEVQPLPAPVKKSVDTVKTTSGFLPKAVGDIHVGLFLPLSLGMAEMVDVHRVAKSLDKLPEESKTALEFYEGFKMAWDSLRAGGFKGTLHVYDYAVDSASFVKLMKKVELKEMDLIIGPHSGKKLEIVMKFAKANNIPFVSPSAQSNNILMGNPHVVKITPSYASQAELLAQYVSSKHAGQNILVFNSANPKDRPFLNTFKKTANPALRKVNADSATEVTFSTLKNFISKSKVNIVVLPSTNPSFITEAINKLYQHKQENIKDSVLIFGFSNWPEIESVDFEYLKKLYAHISDYHFTDYSLTSTKWLVMKYRAEYGSEPGSHVFNGFDTGYFFLLGLQQHGNELLSKLSGIPGKGVQTEFRFSQPDPGSGFENKGLGVMRFENYSYLRVF